MKSAQMRRFLIIISFAVLYTYAKAAQLLPARPLAAVGLAALFLFVMLSGTFAYRSKPEVYDKVWFKLLSWSGSIAMGLWATFIILSLPFDFLRLAVYGVELAAGHDLIASETFTAFYFWLAGAALALALAGFVQAVRGPVLRKVTINVEKLHPSLHGFKIAQISDLHVGPTIRKAYVEEVVRRTNEAAANVVVFTGDIVDGHADSVGESLAPLTGVQASHGRFYVTGNHEYYWNAAAIIRRLEEAGLQPLLNASTELRVGAAKLSVGGITDPVGEYMLPGHSPNVPSAAAATADFKMLLSHRPGFAQDAEQAGFHLQLSGHTHSGQFFPFSLFIGFAHAYSRGLYRHGQMWVYVNPGTGYWGPVNRFAVPPEITLITLAREERT